MDTATDPNVPVSWCNVRETIIMLYLSSAQVESSLREGTDAVYQLADSMMIIAESSEKLKDSLGRFKDGVDPSNLDSAKDSNATILAEIKHSVIAHQFHDRITQRLEHVTESLAKLCDLIYRQV